MLTSDVESLQSTQARVLPPDPTILATEPPQTSMACNGGSSDKKKAPAISRKGLFRLDFLAPRPGLEPGTYGLTEPRTSFSAPCKTKILKVFSSAGRPTFWMPNRKPNLWRLCWGRWLEKSNRINELPQTGVEPAKTDRTEPNWAFGRWPSLLNLVVRFHRKIDVPLLV